MQYIQTNEIGKKLTLDISFTLTFQKGMDTLSEQLTNRQLMPITTACDDTDCMASNKL